MQVCKIDTACENIDYYYNKLKTHQTQDQIFSKM